MSLGQIGGEPVLNLTGQPLGPPPPPPIVAPVPFDPARTREAMRGWIAIALLILFGIMLLALIALLWEHFISPDDTIKLAGALIGPIITLLGAVTGFYFGTVSQGGSRSGSG